MLAKREGFRIKGKRRQIPNILGLLFRNAHLAENPEQKLRMERDPDTGLPQIYLMPHIRKTTLKDGVAVSLTLDASRLEQGAGHPSENCKARREIVQPGTTCQPYGKQCDLVPSEPIGEVFSANLHARHTARPGKDRL
ncbi:MAG: hypothetical protein WDM89_22645 [Rhizomicrobium sp.]